VQLRNDPGQRLELFFSGAPRRPGACGLKYPGVTLQRDPAAPGLLDAVRLHVNVLLYLAGQLVPVPFQEPAQMTGKDVELLEIGVLEGQDLGKEGIESNVIGEKTPKLN